METEKITLKILLISIMIVILSELTAILIASKTAYSHMFIIGMLRIVESGLLIWIMIQCSMGLKGIGLSKSDIIPGIKKGFIWSAGFGIVVLIAGGIIFLFGKNPLMMLRSDLPGSIANIIMFFIVGGILSPVAEEIFFRGVIYGFFRRWGVAAAVAISTVLFVLPHMANTSVPLIQMIGGIIFACAYEIEKRMMVPIIIHVLGNLALFSISLI